MLVGKDQVPLSTLVPNVVQLDLPRSLRVLVLVPALGGILVGLDTRRLEVLGVLVDLGALDVLDVVDGPIPDPGVLLDDARLIGRDHDLPGGDTLDVEALLLHRGRGREPEEVPKALLDGIPDDGVLVLLHRNGLRRRVLHRDRVAHHPNAAEGPVSLLHGVVRTLVEAGVGISYECVAGILKQNRLVVYGYLGGLARGIGESWGGLDPSERVVEVKRRDRRLDRWVNLVDLDPPTAVLVLGLL